MRASAATAIVAKAGSGEVTGRKGKLNIILDPALDVELIPLSQDRIREIFEAYRDDRGGFPAEDVEPSNAQLSALSVIISDLQYILFFLSLSLSMILFEEHDDL